MDGWFTFGESMSSWFIFLTRCAWDRVGGGPSDMFDYVMPEEDRYD